MRHRAELCRYFLQCSWARYSADCLPQEDIDKLMDDAARGANAGLSIDLEAQEIAGPMVGSSVLRWTRFAKHVCSRASMTLRLH